MSIHHQNVFACVVFVVAALTDWFDGYLARSRVGADFEFRCASSIRSPTSLWSVRRADECWCASDRCDAHRLPIYHQIGREITISALREWMAKIGAGKSVAVSFVGKLKTTAQMVAIPMLLYNDNLLGLPVHVMGTVLIVVAAVLTVWSMIYYLRKAAPDLRRES